jgi:hypothetical protein
MTVDELFDEFANCFAVTVDDHHTTQLCYPQYYNPEDRCGDDTQPMVEMLDAELCIEPSDITSIKCSDYMITVNVKEHNRPITFQFLLCKKFVADPMGISTE